MDIRDLKFENSSFDIAIDKGELPWRTMKPLTDVSSALGTMDAMMTAKGDVWAGIPGLRYLVHY